MHTERYTLHNQPAHVRAEDLLIARAHEDYPTAASVEASHIYKRVPMFGGGLLIEGDVEIAM